MGENVFGKYLLLNVCSLVSNGLSGLEHTIKYISVFYQYIISAAGIVKHNV